MEYTTIECLRDKEVVNICDGKKLGSVCDVQIDICSGRMVAIVIPGECNFLGISKNDDIIIPWDKIERISDEIILVRVDDIQDRCCSRPRKKFF